jgi:hypothetical protein
LRKWWKLTIYGICLVCGKELLLLRPIETWVREDFIWMLNTTSNAELRNDQSVEKATSPKSNASCSLTTVFVCPNSFFDYMCVSMLFYSLLSSYSWYVLVVLFSCFGLFSRNFPAPYM